MEKEDHCTFKDKECKQIPKRPRQSGKSVWWHLRGLTCNDPKDPNYIETGGKPGSYLLYHSTPERRAEYQSEMFTIAHSCRLCRKRIDELFQLWDEIELLLR